MELLILVNKENQNYFQFKLIYKKFMPNPFFRFDSYGPSHRNIINGENFINNLITTPHFHKFNEKGIGIAYKTDKLLDKNESIALSDINFSICHFFHESNTRLIEDSFPEVKILPEYLDIEIKEEDPNNNINFI